MAATRTHATTTRTLSEEMAAFAVRASYDDLSESARLQLKIRILDSLACAIGAIQWDQVRLVRGQVEDFGGNPKCTLIGGGRTAPDRAALYNGALVRFLDFNDSYLAKGETCHPSDNLAPVLAAVEYAGGDGRDLMTALAVAYQVQCRLSDAAPVRARGFDHTTQGSYAVAAGVSRALGLDKERTASAIAISGTAFNALRVTRTGAISHWKGLAYPNTAFGATHAAFLAMRGITGPREVFEGNKGFMESVSGPFTLDWSAEDLERVNLTILKRYNAEIHSQSAIEGVLELKEGHAFEASQVKRVDIETFDVAYHIIGGGEEGDKRVVHTKEEADHSLNYMVAVALLDDEVMPEQYLPERIRKRDVQDLLRRVVVRPSVEHSRRFPQEMPCHLKVFLNDGRVLEKEKRDYAGFHTSPVGWDWVEIKFHRLAQLNAHNRLRREIAQTVRNLETARIKDLAALLAQVGGEAGE